MALLKARVVGGTPHTPSRLYSCINCKPGGPRAGRGAQESLCLAGDDQTNSAPRCHRCRVPNLAILAATGQGPN